MIPWVPLTDFSGPPEAMIRRCRDVIGQRAPPAEKANLLAVSQVLTHLRYNDSEILTLFGGTKAMIESPLIQELVRETAHRAILTVLEARFGEIPREVAEAVTSVSDDNQIRDLVRKAAACPDLDAFRSELARK